MDPAGFVSGISPAELMLPGARYVATCFWAWLCVRVLDGQRSGVLCLLMIAHGDDVNRHRICL